MYKTFAALALASLTALGCSGNSLSGTDPNGNGNDDGGSGNGDGGNGNGDGGIDRDAACGDVRAQATLAKSPVDVIFVVDNSGSMTLEIQSVEKNINQSFAAIIAARYATEREHIAHRRPVGQSADGGPSKLSRAWLGGLGLRSARRKPGARQQLAQA